MPTIKVNTSKLSSYESEMQHILNRVNSIKSQFLYASRNLDWEIKVASNINSRISAIERELFAESEGISGMKKYLSNAKVKYDAVDKMNKNYGINNLNLFRVNKVDINNMKSATEKTVNSSEKNKLIFSSSIGSYFDIKSFFKDVSKAGGQIYDAVTKGFFKSNFRVVRDRADKYVIAKGAPSARTTLKDSYVESIKGTRYKVGSEKYINSGIAAFDPKASLLTKTKSSFMVNFSGFTKDTFWIRNSAGKVNFGALAGYTAIAYDTVTNLVGNCKAGAGKSKIAADLIIDLIKGSGEMAAVSAGAKAGAAIGTLIPVPVVGTLVGGVIGGAVASFGYNYLFDGGVKIGEKSISEKASEGLESVINKVSDSIKENSDKTKFAKVVVGAGEIAGNTNLAMVY